MTSGPQRGEEAIDQQRLIDSPGKATHIWGPTDDGVFCQL
jgi:hypothetical protein